jgi:hypothetical protein
LAALTMAVLAVTPLLAIFHLISSPHAVCEHGELVETGDIRLSGDPAGLDADMAARDAKGAATSLIRSDSDGDRASHSHCSVGTLAKHSAGLLPCTHVVAALSEVAAHGIHHREFAYLRTILFSAPKTSPPHVAS